MTWMHYNSFQAGFLALCDSRLCCLSLRCFGRMLFTHRGTRGRESSLMIRRSHVAEARLTWPATMFAAFDASSPRHSWVCHVSQGRIRTRQALSFMS
jgi:hypothetical protein